MRAAATSSRVTARVKIGRESLREYKSLITPEIIKPGHQLDKQGPVSVEVYQAVNELDTNVEKVISPPRRRGYDLNLHFESRRYLRWSILELSSAGALSGAHSAKRISGIDSVRMK
jgi:hypothetical protein